MASPNANLYGPSTAFYNHSSAPRISTDATFFRAVQTAHPFSHITILPEFSSPLKAYVLSAEGAAATKKANGGGATITPLDESNTLAWLIYLPPARRLDGGTGVLAKETFYETYLLRYASHEFLVYFADGRDGSQPYPQNRNQYVVSASGGEAAGVLANLARDAGQWANALHDEIWVFENGWWQKDAALYANIMKSRWEDVILHQDLKDDLVDTVSRFFDSRHDYDRLGVPWKRGLIFYGPPGNGKTISIKATMHTLYTRKPSSGGPVPTLYVKSLTSFAGPEFSISQIFERARAEAPCYLVFEDLDSMVSDSVRSFFLNAVDGLGVNEGVLMVGSTNHLERLDPGIAKRPSRFDRKYLFDDPDRELREKYAQFWRQKVLAGGSGPATATAGARMIDGNTRRKGQNQSQSQRNRKSESEEDVEFPKVLCGKIAGITDGFSFAYMQEAFISSLLAIANRQREDRKGDRGVVVVERGLLGGERWEVLDLECDSETEPEDESGGDDDDDDDDGDELDRYVLWREIKKQVENLRKEMDKKKQQQQQ